MSNPQLEQERGMSEAFRHQIATMRSDIARVAKKIAFDHPNLESLSPVAKLHAIEQCHDGVLMAVADMHQKCDEVTKERDHLAERVKTLEAERAELLKALKRLVDRVENSGYPMCVEERAILLAKLEGTQGA